MCSISGIISKDKLNSSDIQMANHMGEKLIHRGPDGEGSFKDDHVALVMRRLSIIDLTGGQQPLYNEDKTIALICNGEIYNFVELRGELEKRGHHFSTKSDCETIIHAYEEYGMKFIEFLRGMFAFCLYDMKNSKTIVARDRLGEKPLYFYKNDGTLIFSSEMKSIIEAIPREKRALNEESVFAYFHFGYVPEPYTLIKEVHKLAPGHMLICDIKDFNITDAKYWNMETVPALTIENRSQEVRRRLDEVEKIIIRSDVPVGVSLSGGIDSSIIATLAARYSKEKLHAFSVGYPGRPDNDERTLAKTLADKLGMVFHDIEITTEEMVDGFERMIYDMDDPIADIAAYGYYAVAREARKEGVPVLLAGFGGDELFWGYEWARKAAHYKTLKSNFKGKILLFFTLARESRKKILKRPVSTIARLYKHAFFSTPLLYQLTSAWRRADEYQKEIFTERFLGHVRGTLENMPEISITKNTSSSVSVLLTRVWLISNCVALGDRLSMAHSVELRLPFLDYKLYESVLGMRKNDSTDYVRGYKYDLIEATKDIIPEEILARKKRGFSPPSTEWLHAIIEKHGRSLTEGELVKRGIIRKEYMSRALADSRSQSQFLYSALVLETWMRSYIPS